MTQPSTLYLVATAAPLTQRIHDAVIRARERGWEPAVIATPAAEAWLPSEQLDRADVPVLTEHRQPSEAKRLPAASAIVLAPGTFNSINKLATGIADNYAMSVLCEAISTKTRTIIVPFVSSRLAGHPAWLASLAVLRYAGVTLVDPRTGAVNFDEPIESGTGQAVVAQFRWDWAFDQF